VRDLCGSLSVLHRKLSGLGILAVWGKVQIFG
jgi:hypothetical protein